LPPENEDQIRGFLARDPRFRAVAPGDAWLASIGTPMPESLAVPLDSGGKAARLTPALSQTDGFFVAILQRGEA